MPAIPLRIWHRSILRITLALLLGPGTICRAQRQPHIAYILPAGGQQGTTFEVVIGGQFLNGTTNVYVTGGGVRTDIIDYSRPLTPRELNELREQARKLQERKASLSRNRANRGRTYARDSTDSWTAEDEKQLAELRKRIADANRRPNPEIADPVTVRMSIASDAELGLRELRLKTAAGLSNPLVFHVDQLPEFTEEAGAPDSRARYGRFSSHQAASSTVENEVNISIPAILNGQIMPGGVDRYRFSAQAGQRLVMAVRARELIPYLANAVPGWFQATLTLYDANGRELAYQDDFRHNPDPAFFFEVPEDGQYVIAIRDSIYRGREDFVYRLTIGEVPFVTSIFPLGGTVGDEAIVAATGWNLATNAFSITVTDQQRGMTTVCVTNGGFVSNRLPFAADTLPECMENEFNNSLATAQPVSMPVIVNGRIDHPGDWDIFRFQGAAGKPVVAEVQARRLNSPLDSMLKLTDGSGRQIAFNDDHDDRGAGLTSHHADSYLRVNLPADGTYYVHLGDTQQKGSSEYGYRLRLSEARPDFELRAVPSTINVRGGASVPLTVYALRKDGFTNEIRLELKDSPAGIALSGGWIPAGQDKVRLTLSAARRSEEPIAISLQGRALIDGVERVRAAVPADDLMQAFAYRHLVPARELKVNVSGRSAQRQPVRILTGDLLRIPSGGTAQVRFNLPERIPSAPVQFELSDAPDGITIDHFSTGDEALEIVFRAERNKVSKALQGNLIVNVERAADPESEDRNTQAGQRRAFLGCLPAIPFEIVGN